MKRLMGSAAAGAAVATALVVFEDKKRHVALAASAAKSHHTQTVASILASGFIFTTLVVGLIVYVLATVMAHRKRGAAGPSWQSSYRRAGARR